MNVPRRAVRSRLAASAVAVCLVHVAIASLSNVEPASAAGVAGFSVTPGALDGQPARSYFRLELAPGQRRTQTVVVENRATVPQTLRIRASTGVTAPGSGSAYRVRPGRCRGTGCWISGLPRSITLAARASRALRFEATVPPAAEPRQYLAGISIQPDSPGRTQTLRARGGTRLQAVVVHRVDMGVAVTVGDRRQLRRGLAISSMTGTTAGPLPRLLVHERNTGQTFVRGKGRATCAPGGERLIVPVTSETVLPGDRASLVVNAEGLPTGASFPCSVRIRYGPGLVARWSGMVRMPAATEEQVVQTGDGTYSVVPRPPGMPTWAKVLAALGAMIVLLLVVAIALLLRRRRRRAPAAARAAAAPSARPSPAIHGD